MSLPKYKSGEYYPEFRCDEYGIYNRDPEKKAMFEKFKRDGELTAGTPICIKKDGKDFEIFWKRKTAKGTEKVLLFWIEPDDVFLQFIDEFFRAKKLFPLPHTAWNKVAYGAISSICRFYKERPEQFKEALGKVANIDEMALIAGFRN